MRKLFFCELYAERRSPDRADRALKGTRMQIVPYQAAHLPGLYEAYRQTTANVPHCRFIPSLNYIGRALALAEQAGASLLVAEEHSVVQGVATLRPVAPDSDGVPQLEITG